MDNKLSGDNDASIVKRCSPKSEEEKRPAIDCLSDQKKRSLKFEEKNPEKILRSSKNKDPARNLIDQEYFANYGLP